MILKLDDLMMDEVAAGRRRVDVRPCRIDEARPGDLLFEGRRDHSRYVVVDVVHVIHTRLRDVPEEFLPEVSCSTREELAREIGVSLDSVVTLLTFVPTEKGVSGGSRRVQHNKS